MVLTTARVTAWLRFAPSRPLRRRTSTRPTCGQPPVIFSYVKALRIRRLTFEAGALFAGRMPMTSCFIGGGVTFDGTEDLTKRIQKYSALMAEVGKFVLQEYIPIVLAFKFLYPDNDNVNNGSTLSGSLPRLALAAASEGSCLGAVSPVPTLQGTLAIKGGVYDGGVVFTAANKAKSVRSSLVRAPTRSRRTSRRDIESSRYSIASQDTTAYGVNGLGTAGALTAAYPGAVSRTKPHRNATNGYTYMKAPRWGGKSMGSWPAGSYGGQRHLQDRRNAPAPDGGFLGTALSPALYLKNVGAGPAFGLDPKLVSADVAVALFRAGLATLWYFRAGEQQRAH